MSSKKAGWKPAHRKSKVSWATLIGPGLGDPNFASERAQGMEEQVNIPALYRYYPRIDAFWSWEHILAIYVYADESRDEEAKPPGRANFQ